MGATAQDIYFIYQGCAIHIARHPGQEDSCEGQQVLTVGQIGFIVYLELNEPVKLEGEIHPC